MARKIIVCPDCGARFDVAPFAAGARVRCGRCSRVLVVPETAPEPPPSPPRPPALPRHEQELRSCRTVEFEGATRPTIGGHVLLELVSRGGCSFLNLCHDPRTGRRLVLERLHVVPERREFNQLARVLAAARSAAETTSERLIRVFDVGVDEASQIVFTTMEHVPGVDLNDRRAWGGDADPPRESDALDLGVATAAALAAVHAAGLVHGAVKPGKIRLPPDAAGLPSFAEAKLAHPARSLFRAEDWIDLGAWEDDRLFTGNPFLFLPRDAMNGSATPCGRAGLGTCATDAYGLGAVLYWFLTGAPPVLRMTDLAMGARPRPIAELRPDLSAAFVAVVERCLDADPARRFADGAASLDALRACRVG